MTQASHFRRLVSRFVFAAALVNAVAANAFALSKESERRLNEIQLEAASELRALQSDFKKRIQARRDEPILTPEERMEAEVAPAVAIASASTEAH